MSRKLLRPIFDLLDRACDLFEDDEHPAVVALLEAWLSSDEERDYYVRDEGGEVEMTSYPDDIEEEIKTSVINSWCYDDSGTGDCVINWYRPVAPTLVQHLVDATHDKCVEIEVPDEDPAPDCDHDWQSPEWLGGCKENPGVWATGGANIHIKEVCSQCGIERMIDTHAQNNYGDTYRRVSYTRENCEENLERFAECD